MKKKEIDIKVGVPEAPVSKSKAKAEFKDLIEAYAKQSPEKYEHKKASLEARLAKL